MFQVEFTPGAEADLARLDKTIAQRVLKKIRWLSEHFASITPEILTGPWQGVFKLRVGDYRVLYTCDREKQKIIVHVVRHCREIYKERGA